MEILTSLISGKQNHVNLLLIIMKFIMKRISKIKYNMQKRLVHNG